MKPEKVCCICKKRCPDVPLILISETFHNWRVWTEGRASGSVMNRRAFPHLCYICPRCGQDVIQD